MALITDLGMKRLVRDVSEAVIWNAKSCTMIDNRE